MASNNIPTILNQVKSILGNYKPNQNSIELLKKISLVTLTSATSAGKDSIISKLLESKKYSNVITDTTRPKRINDGVLETNGQNYWFLNERQFLEGLRQGDYLEAAVVHQDFIYGTSIKALQAAVSTGKIPILDLDIVGSEHIQQCSSGVKAIFILPPNFKEWMRRLEHRGEMNQAEKQIRLESAAREVSGALARPYFRFFVNDDLDLVTHQIDDFVMTNQLNLDLQNESKNIAKQLLIDLKNYLN
jgi:guanylate kinase